MNYEKNEEAIRIAFEKSLRSRDSVLSLSRTDDGRYVSGQAANLWATWCDGLAYQAGLASAEDATHMRPEQAQKWGWAEVRKDVGIDGWSVGDTCNFMGFFHWGWHYRGQYELQRMSLPKSATAQDLPAWRDRLGGHTEPLNQVEQVMDEEIRELRKFIALHLARLSPAAFDQYEYCYFCEDGNKRCMGECTDAGLFGKSADTPELRNLLTAWRQAIGTENAEKALKDIIVAVNSKVAKAKSLSKRKDEPKAARGERITNDSFQTLSMASTFLGTAMMLLPTVSWRDGALKVCEDLKELLSRNFAVQLTAGEGRRMGHKPVVDKLLFEDLKLPFAMRGSDGASEKYTQGFNACLEKVIALNNTSNAELKLPPVLTWTDSASVDYVVGFNACRDKVLELNRTAG